MWVSVMLEVCFWHSRLLLWLLQTQEAHKVQRVQQFNLELHILSSIGCGLCFQKQPADIDNNKIVMTEQLKYPKIYQHPYHHMDTNFLLETLDIP